MRSPASSANSNATCVTPPGRCGCPARSSSTRWRYWASASGSRSAATAGRPSPSWPLAWHHPRRGHPRHPGGPEPTALSLDIPVVDGEDGVPLAALLAAADIEVFTTTTTTTTTTPFAILQSLRLDRGPSGPVHP